jgi:formate hydrogenlyase subunit 3/multisubunit Na+/H+ antiporter MnhD subunit
MNISPLIPLVFLGLGAGAVLVGLHPRFRYPGLVASAAAALALLSLLALGTRLPARAALSNWGPPSLLPVGLVLEVDPLAWVFGAGMVAAALTTLLTGAARPGGRRTIVRMGLLLLAFAGLAAVLAENLITRITAWAGLDLVYFVTLILLAEGEGLEPQAVLNLAFNAAGTLLAVGAALLIARTSDTLSLRDAALSSSSTLLITLAVILRLGLFPLHLGLPAEANIRQGLGTLLRLIPAAMALEVVARLSVFGIAAPLRPWLTVFGALAALAGAWQLWNVDDPRRGLTYLIIAQSGTALLAGLWGGASALTAVSLALLLGGAAIYLANGHDPNQPLASVFSVLGVLAVLGAPLTVGFIGQGALYGGLLAARQWPALVLVALAQIILAGGLLRAVFVEGRLPGGEPMVRAVYFAGLALPALLLIAAGVMAGRLSPALGSAAWLGWAGPSSVIGASVAATAAVGGLVLWRFESLVRTRAELAGAVLTSLFRLDWLYRLVWGAFRLLVALIHTAAEVLEGEGAMLWMLVVVVLAWLVFR